MNFRGMVPSAPAPPPYIVYTFGGMINDGATGENYLIVNGNSGNGIEEVPTYPSTGTNLLMGWNAAALIRIDAQCYTADATSKFNMWKNGTQVGTISLVGPYTVITDISENLVLGDQLAFSWNPGDGGTNPTYTTLSCVFQVDV
jgi:hypothetical protein